MKEFLHALILKTRAHPQWEKIGIRPHHGICLPLFSLLTEQSCGIGEFFDLLPLIDWIADIGMDVIQLLPLNDGGLETSPYNALSAHALNPLFLSLSLLPDVSSLPDYQAKIDKMRYWNRSQRVKYPIVRELKMAFLRDYVAMVYPSLSKTAEYQSFIKKNEWLESYALFKVLKEKNYWKSWEEWPLALRSPSVQGYQSLCAEHAAATIFHECLQYLAFQQLTEVKRRANARGVYLKGDIPILISPDSADVWHRRRYFLLDRVAGAPPDMYARKGQYWGFPIYDWVALERHRYDWWRERLRVADQLYNLYRIDHIVGFFRLWVIQKGKPATSGTFFPAREEEWIPHGKKIMEMMLETTPELLPIGEDLGVIPAAVRTCLADLGICGTKVLRWERYWEGDGDFIPVSAYPPLTMSTVSTHDSDTLQLWWRHAPKEAKRYAEHKGWNYQPFLSATHQKEILRESHHSSSLFHINLLQEYLTLFPEFSHPHAHQERINIPGKVLETNWTYRFRQPLERITSHSALRKVMQELLPPR